MFLMEESIWAEQFISFLQMQTEMDAAGCVNIRWNSVCCCGMLYTLGGQQRTPLVTLDFPPAAPVLCLPIILIFLKHLSL